MIERKKGFLSSIRYFLAPRDLFENIHKLEQELMQFKVEKETELRLTQRQLEDNEKNIKENELLISELKKEIAEIKINAPLKIEEERKKRQSENVQTGMFGFLESISNFMVAIQSGRWKQLPIEEQLLWLNRLQSLLGRGLADSWDLNDNSLSDCISILDAEHKALTKLK